MKKWPDVEYMTTGYILNVRKEIDLEKEDKEMQNAIYVDFLQDMVLALGRGQIKNPKHFARVVHKTFNFKVPL